MSGRPSSSMPVGFSCSVPASSAYNKGVCEAAGLYISLNQCSTSSGLVHRPVSVIISRQMNPTLGCPRPPEPPVQDESPVAFADTLYPMPLPSHATAAPSGQGIAPSLWATPPCLSFILIAPCWTLS